LLFSILWCSCFGRVFHVAKIRNKIQERRRICQTSSSFRSFWISEESLTSQPSSLISIVVKDSATSGHILWKGEKETRNSRPFEKCNDLAHFVVLEDKMNVCQMYVKESNKWCSHFWMIRWTSSSQQTEGTQIDPVSVSSLKNLE
jgi:hypothetical protein